MQVTNEMVLDALNAQPFAGPDNDGTRVWQMLMNGTEGDRIEIMRAALEAALSVAWRPGVDAPRDGTEFIALLHTKAMEIVRISSDDELFIASDGEFVDPKWIVFWQPLPLPPQTKEG